MTAGRYDVDTEALSGESRSLRDARALLPVAAVTATDDFGSMIPEDLLSQASQWLALSIHLQDDTLDGAATRLQDAAAAYEAADSAAAR